MMMGLLNLFMRFRQYDQSKLTFKMLINNRGKPLH